MRENSLILLKTGLLELEKGVGTRRKHLLDCLQRQEKISEEEEAWLDNDANCVDEEAIIGTLEKASDFEHALSQLNPEQKKVVERLRELGRRNQEGSYIGNKRKRKCCGVLSHTAENLPQMAGCNENKTKERAPAKKAKNPVFTKKENATLAQRIQILTWHHKSEKKSQSKTAQYWDKIYPNLRLKQPIISAWLRDEPKWRTQWANAEHSVASAQAKRVKQTEHPEVTKLLELWVSRALQNRIVLTGDLLREKWRRFADLANVPEDERLTLSDGWLTAFKKRCGLREFKCHGEAGSANPENIEGERRRLRELIESYGYGLQDIFNMDETGLFFAYVF